jgi:hypothetical protein
VVVSKLTVEGGRPVARILREFKQIGCVSEPVTEVTVACPQCGELVEVKDATTLFWPLHMQNDCNVSGLLVHQVGGGE